MKTRYFSRVGSAILAVAVFGTAFASAQSGAPVTPGRKAPTTQLSNRTLQRSGLVVNTGIVSANCSTSGCSASTAVFVKNTLCPRPAGKTCTLYINLESQVEVTTDDNGLFKFLVDGVPPSPGPTDGTGLVRWVLGDPDSGSIDFEARSFGVVATITNSIANQNHPVEVDIACQDITCDGCSASMGFASLNIAVYTP
jgi:hypothetical protein